MRGPAIGLSELEEDQGDAAPGDGRIARGQLADQGELRRIAELIDMMGSPCMLVDVGDYSIVHANEAAGGTPAQPTTCHTRSHGLAEPCDHRGIVCPLRQVIARGEPVVVEHVHLGRSGEGRVIEVHAHPVFDPDGEVTHILESTVDVTERRLAERTGGALAMAFDRAPTALLLLDPDGRLVHASAEANRLCTAGPLEIGTRPDLDGLRLSRNAREVRVERVPLPEFGGGQPWTLVLLGVSDSPGSSDGQAPERTVSTAGVAHDVNNILQTISAQAEVLRSGEAGADPGLAEEILHQVARGSRLVRQLLDFSRRSESQARPVDLVDLLQECTRGLRATLPASIRFGCEVTLDLDPLILGDDLQLERAFTNLLVNARDAMPNGGRLAVRVSSVSIGPGDPTPFSGMLPGEWLRVQIEDQGAGISPANRPLIFRPFFTTKGARGTGLGLAQAYGIVKQHGGFIDFTSTVGKGTTFEVYLPALAAPNGDRLSSELGLEPARVLLIEDEESLLRILEKALVARGFQVLAATTAAAALHHVESRPEDISLVLADQHLPDADGAGLLDDLHRRLPRARLILMSGLQRPRQPSEIAFEQLEKPFDLRQLFEMVHQIGRAR